MIELIKDMYKYNRNVVRINNEDKITTKIEDKQGSLQFSILIYGVMK